MSFDDDWADNWDSTPAAPEFPEFDDNIPAGGVKGPEFTPIEPPANLWENVIESLMGFTAKIAGIDIPDVLTATQGVVEHVFGKPKTEESSAKTITETMRLGGDQGILNRRLDTGDGWMVRQARKQKAEDDEEGAKTSKGSLALMARLALRAGRALGKVAIAVGPVGWAIGALIAAAVGAAVVIGKMSHMGWEQINAVAKYNGTLLAAQKRLEVGNLLREIDMAQHVAEPGAEHMANQERIHHALHYWKVLWAKLSTTLGAYATGVIADWAENPVGAAADMLAPDWFLSILGAVGMPVDATSDDNVVAEAKQFGRELFDNPLAALAGGTIDMFFPDAVLQAVGLGAEADDEAIALIKDMFAWAKIRWPEIGEDNRGVDQLGFHHLLIGTPQPPPVPGLGAAPAP